MRLRDCSTCQVRQTSHFHFLFFFWSFRGNLNPVRAAVEPAALGRIRLSTHVKSLKPSFVGLAEVSCPDISKGSEFYFDILQFAVKTLMDRRCLDSLIFRFPATFNAFPAFKPSSSLIGQVKMQSSVLPLLLSVSPALLLLLQLPFHLDAQEVLLQDTSCSWKCLLLTLQWPAAFCQVSIVNTQQSDQSSA